MFGYINAVVLLNHPLGEIDRRYIVFSDKLGKISLISKRGSLHYNSNSGILNALNSVRILICREGYSKSYYIRDAELLSGYSNIKTEPKKFATAYFFLYILDKVFQEQNPEVKVFSLIKDYFQVLNKDKDLDFFLFKDMFLWQVSNELGFMPELKVCSNCSKDIDAKHNFFSIQTGGLLCKKCTGLEINYKKISPGSVNFVRKILTSKLSKILSLRYTSLARRELDILSEQYLSYHSEKSLVLFRNFLSSYEIKE